jgi:hypothetical protein
MTGTDLRHGGALTFGLALGIVITILFSHQFRTAAVLSFIGAAGLVVGIAAEPPGSTGNRVIGKTFLTLGIYTSVAGAGLVALTPSSVRDLAVVIAPAIGLALVGLWAAQAADSNSVRAAARSLSVNLLLLSLLGGGLILLEVTVSVLLSLPTYGRLIEQFLEGNPHLLASITTLGLAVTAALFAGIISESSHTSGRWEIMSTIGRYGSVSSVLASVILIADFLYNAMIPLPTALSTSISFGGMSLPLVVVGTATVLSTVGLVWMVQRLARILRGRQAIGTVRTAGHTAVFFIPALVTTGAGAILAFRTDGIQTYVTSLSRAETPLIDLFRVYTITATGFLDGFLVVLIAAVASLTVAVVGLRVTVRVSRSLSVRQSTNDVLPLAIGLFVIASIATLLRGEVVLGVAAFAMTFLAWDSALGLEGTQETFQSHRRAIKTQAPHLIGTGSVLLLGIGCYYGVRQLLVAGRIATVPTAQVQLAVVLLGAGLVILVTTIRPRSATS